MLSQELAIYNYKINNSECGRLQNVFTEKASLKFSSSSCRNDRTKKNVQKEIDKILEKKAIFSVQNKPDKFLSPIFIVSKKIERFRFVIILEILNCHA